MDQEIQSMLHLTFSNSIEAADTERRIISGKIAPYGEVGYTSAGPVVFERGAISIPDTAKIKLLMQHDSTKPVGRATNFSDGTDGIYASFKISSSTRGQDALVLAQENLVSGLSVGVDVTASKPMKDYLLVTAAVLKEVSLVESAAFSSAAVTDIAAAKAALEAATSNSTSTKTITTNTTINTVTTEVETETETESEAAVTTAPMDTPDVPAEKAQEAAPVEAARPIIRPSVLDSQTVRTPINSMAKYTEHKIKAALGDRDSILYVTAADDSFTTNPAFNPTQYLSEFVSNTNFDTPMINALSQGVLPNSGMTISVPSLVTSAGGQSGVAPVVTVEAEAGAVQNTGMVTQYLSGTVKKYSGMNTISIELLERSDPNFYAELTNQLQRAYSLATDAAVIADVVAGGVQGTAVAATSAGIISYVSTESANIYKNTSYFAKNYIAGPSQWSLLMGATDSTGRPIYNAGQPMNSGGLSTPTSIRGNVLGLDLYVDHQMVSTTIDDSAFIVAPEAMTVYRSPQAYMSVNVVSNLQIQVAIYGFMATIVKMPNGLVRYNLT
jgi:HK97 family phage prohead protease